MQLAGSGMNVLSGSQLSAGIAPATLKLFRGGQVRICPRSGLSATTSGQGLMLATGAGAIEIDYQLNQQVTDVLITPDFNVMLVGPGTFHFALGVNKSGDTCVKPLPGNDSAGYFFRVAGNTRVQGPAGGGAHIPWRQAGAAGSVRRRVWLPSRSSRSCEQKRSRVQRLSRLKTMAQSQAGRACCGRQHMAHHASAAGPARTGACAG